MKRIVVERVGFNTTEETQIAPGATVEDVLKQLKLGGHVLKMDPGKFHLRPSDNLYDKVTDGQKVFVVSITLG